MRDTLINMSEALKLIDADLLVFNSDTGLTEAVKNNKVVATYKNPTVMNGKLVEVIYA